ncbi:MAG: 2-hydroxyacid dehydrogenase [Dehalococcoidia bacterium]|nr:2-hydroxyacid dehydrogenase [Dehalococcoidia bacterium]MCB9484533.1 2-hydroxyacid dehydrogenase [Thermoflexaceae bacterium]
MELAFFSTKSYERASFEAAASRAGHRISFLEPRLTAGTAALASGFPAVCAFVNDELQADTLSTLQAGGTRLILLRSAGFNHVDLNAATRLGLIVAHVPAYSPNAVAEHTIALILTLNRKTHRAYARVRDGNFSLDGLLGFDLSECTAGVVGTGKIGALVARILLGFGCEVLAHDPYPSPDVESMGARYTSLDELLAESDVISLHCPLVAETYHLINAESLSRMRSGVMLINTGRGGLVDAPAVIEGLKSRRIGYLGLDVYEEEADLFFVDRSAEVLTDDTFARLLTFPNVLITGHQGFFTYEALQNIAETTIANLTAWERGTGDLVRVPQG